MSAQHKSIAIGKPLVILGVLLPVFIILMLGSLVYVGDKRAALQRHVELSADQLLLSQQMATFSLGASSGSEASFDRLLDSRIRFDTVLDTYRSGDLLTEKLSEELIPELDPVEEKWRNYRNNIEVILNGRQAITEVKDLYEVIESFIPQMLTYSDEVVGVLIKKKASSRQIYLATRQMMLSQRIKNNLNQVLAGGEAAAAAADRFGRDAALFGRVLEGLLKGSKGLRIEKVTDKEAIGKLREVAMLISAVSDNIAGILELSPELFEVKDAAGSVGTDSENLLIATEAFQEKIIAQGEQLDNIQLLGVGFGGAAVLFIIIGGILMLKQARKREENALENNRRNQRAILQLLDEMANLADGDLTVHATVSEEITGAIADSVNFTIDALRSLVTTINTTASEVSESTERTQHTATELAEASNKQAREIASASAAVTDMADSMSAVSEDADNSAQVAQQSVDIAQKGAQVVRNSIGSMENIRETIQETSKRIKRLGESSQEIGDIVGLITEIADQTNILALNAAIQASTAGDAGRGFAVVADEVQRLAERAGNATKQIEGLVNTIQADTNEAVKSMELSTAGVVNGAAMAEDAGVALKEIESVSNELSHLIKGISDSTKQQSKVALSVSDTMNIIQEITLQTSEGTEETSTSLTALNELSSELGRSVSGFKLPSSNDDGSVETVILQSQA
ncbi:MAG: type IV pili methyl-accepting chemotaxis transducer N-terminal domain-containing protein [Gammaproteobacteria bacterium]|nr:type IV pili methyl-accepting chemotaxis transducer N-terminal domain-containing protein [Gammaproteobacteria bacterium]